MNRCEVRDYGYGTGPFEWLGIRKTKLTGNEFEGEVELSFEVRDYCNSTRKHTVYVVSVYIDNFWALLTDNYYSLDEAERAFDRRLKFVRHIVRPIKETEIFKEVA